MISTDEAKDIIKEFTFNLLPAKMELLDSKELILAEDVFAICDIPAYAQSSMDGYAFSFDDNISELKIVGEMAAGTSSQIAIRPNQATRIFTGAPLPNGADTVIMQEKVDVSDGKIILKDENLVKGQHVRQKGAEVENGSLAMSVGTLLTPAAIGFLAGIGITEVVVFPPPRIAIILTGNELQTPGNHLEFGQVYEANSFMLKSALDKIGIKNIAIFKAEDRLSAVENVLTKALDTSNVVFLTGGVSVGDFDFVSQAAENCGVKIHFHKIKQKPGKPLLFGTKEEKIVFGLPGNPSSGLVCFYEYVQPMLEKMMQKKTGIISTKADLTHGYKKNPGLTHFLKGHFENGKATPLHAQESFRLHSFSQANCLIVLEESRGNYEAGERVEVHFI